MLISGSASHPGTGFHPGSLRNSLYVDCKRVYINQSHFYVILNVRVQKKCKNLSERKEKPADKSVGYTEPGSADKGSRFYLASPQKLPPSG